jgi:Chitin binding Peritrophin-A domain
MSSSRQYRCKLNEFRLKPRLLSYDFQQVGVQSDLTCRTYKFCLAGVLGTETESCGVGTRFNRDTGLCDLEANVPCLGGAGGGPVSDVCVDPITTLPITGDVDSPTACPEFQVIYSLSTILISKS